MKIRKYQATEEKQILTGMIVSTPVLSKIHSHLKGERSPFRSRWCNLVAGWCLTYFAKYGKAPRASIQSLFNSYAQKSQSKESVEMVERFLSQLSDDYRAEAKSLNNDHLIDMACRHFNKVRIANLVASLEGDLEMEEIETASSRLSSFRPFKFEAFSMRDVLTDDSLVEEVFNNEGEEALVRYPSALGDFFAGHLCRDGFVAFLAPEKRGKSFWLIDVAWRAMQQKRKVLLYSVGDMSQRQVMRRLISRASRRPIHPVLYEVPKKLLKVEKEFKTIREAKEPSGPLGLDEAKKVFNRIRMKTASKTSLLKLKCTPNSTTSVADIRQDVLELSREGWTPDVIVIDYADILAPEPGSGQKETRHQINETWKALRGLSQEAHCLVVTATQSDASSNEAYVLGRSHFSEDKRKAAHVTGMVGINQTEKEKKEGVYRLNWIYLREGVYYESKCVGTAGSLAICHPSMLSSF